ncbi:hypothetical protein AOE01nite_08960 [Acetobacter oeni]|uniref:Uncharacterized protein n=1 Tax=Acetobacter oeni TaxID=304077 RepID=A0A511XI98_9PROT|nr:hypothetical protein AA21952_3274 [Acetobacter oeni LMG 21952]GEN62672.1 hypothetical protein AOE01nite_08960 [Acetobacter oeni]
MSSGKIPHALLIVIPAQKQKNIRTAPKTPVGLLFAWCPRIRRKVRIVRLVTARKRFVVADFILLARYARVGNIR